MKANFETGLKICSRCKRELPISCYQKDSSNVDGLGVSCKECLKKKRQSPEGREQYKAYRDRYYQTEKGKVCARKSYEKRMSKEENRVANKERAKRWYQQNHQRDRYMRKVFVDDFGNEVLNCTKCGRILLVDEFHKDLSTQCGYDTWCKDCRSQLQKDRMQREDVKEHYNSYMRDYCKTEKGRASKRNSYLKRYRNDPVFRTSLLLRSRLWKFLKGSVKSDKTEKLIGCSWKQLKSYLEEKFQPGMTWDNQGKEWDIDHIIPCSYFDASKEEDQYMCFNFRNLQPLFKDENRKIKRDILPENMEELLEEIRKSLK